ncbi:titin, partial [Bicyclus anynana]|uniref:Titin n=1 Tax=Bicyclus anynana TaxID=110368 RepID=A0ABM3M5P7_BICAN
MHFGTMRRTRRKKLRALRVCVTTFFTWCHMERYLAVGEHLSVQSISDTGGESRKQISQKSHDKKTIVSTLATEDSDTSQTRVLHKTTEESNILKLQNIEDVQTRQVPWRKTRIASLTKLEEQTLETKHWRKPRREDNNLIKDTETEEEERLVRQQSKPKTDKKPLFLDKISVVEDSSVLEISKEEDTKVEMPVEKEMGPDKYPDKQLREQVPWTQEAIKLRPTKVEKTPISKEKFEDVSLKPVRKSSLQKTDAVVIEDSTITSEGLENVKVVEHQSDISKSKTLMQTTEDSSMLDLKQTDEILRKQTTRSKSEIKPLDKLVKDQQVPWTQEAIKLRPTKVEKSPIPKEKFEDVDLRPLRESSLQKIETVVIEDLITAVEDTVILKITDGEDTDKIKPFENDKPYQEIQPETVSWRVGKRQAKEKPLVEESDLKRISKPQVPKEEQPGDKPLIKEKPVEDQKPEEVSWRVGKKRTKEEPLVKAPEEETLEEDAKLKPVQIVKPIDQPEEAKLKPVRKVKLEESTVEEAVLKPGSKQKAPEQEKPEEVKLKPVKKGKPKEEDQQEEVSWRVGKRRPKEEKPVEEVDLKPVPKQKALEEQTPEEVTLEPIKKEKPVEEIKSDEVSWRVGKKRPKEEPLVKEVDLKPISKPKAPEDDKTEEVHLKPVKKEKPTEDEQPKEVSWRVGKRRPKEEKSVEEVDLKPVPKPIAPEEEKPEEIKLKPTKKVKPEEEQKPEEVSWPVGKRRPKEEPSVEEVDLKPIPKPKAPEEDKPEEVKVKPIRKVKPEEPSIEEVVLKPVPKQKAPEEEKSEEIKLKPIPKEKLTEEEQPQEVTWRVGKRRPKEEKPVEEVDLKPVPKPIAPEEEKPEEIKLKPTKKVKPEEEQKPEEVSWPVGKRRPKEKLSVEEVDLKPIPKSKAPEEDKPEEVKLKPIRKVKPEEPSIEEVVLKPVPRQPAPEEEKPEEIMLKPIPKEKLTEEEQPQEVTWRVEKRRPKEEKPVEEVDLKPVPKPIAPAEEEKPEELKLKPMKKVKSEEEQKPEEVSWPVGKRRPKEKLSVEEVDLKPIPKSKAPEEDKPEEVKLKPIRKVKPEEPSIEEVVLKPVPKQKAPEEEKSEEIKLKPVKKEKLTEEEQPQEVTWRVGKRRPKEEKPVEEVDLKPIPKPIAPEEEKPEEIKLKPTKKVKPEEEQKPEEVSWPVGKRRPKEEPSVEEVDLKPIPKPKAPEEDKPEEVKLKPIRKVKPEEPSMEEVVLKPVPRQLAPEEEKPEEIKLKPVPKEKLTEEEQPQEVTWRVGKRRPKEEKPVEEVDLKPVPKPIAPAEEEKPDEIKLKPTKEVKSEEEQKPEEVSWPVGKRRPKEEPLVEDVDLKPIPKPKAPEEEKPEEVKLKPIRKVKPEEPSIEEIVLKPVPKQSAPEEEKPEEIKLKPVPKEKPTEEEQPQEVTWRVGKRRPKEEKPVEEVDLKPVPKPIAPAEEKPEEIKLKPTKKVKPEEEQKPEEVSWPVGKRRPKEEPSVEEVDLKPIPKPKAPEEDKPEEVKVKPIRKVKPEEPSIEEVVLKPVPKQPVSEEEKPEEIKLKPVKKEKLTEEEQPQEVTWRVGKRRPKEEKPVEEVDLKPVPKPIASAEEEKPEEIKLKVTKKVKPEEEQKPEEVSWPVGKRRPKEEPSVEEVDLKPIPKPKAPEEDKPDEVKLKPVRKVKPEDLPVEEVVLKPVPKQKELENEKPEEVKLKPIEKTEKEKTDTLKTVEKHRKKIKKKIEKEETTEVGPLIIQPIKAMNVCDNHDFELEVSFTPNFVDNITWFRNNQLIQKSDDSCIIIENGRSMLKILKADKNKVGKYEVLIQKDDVVLKSACTVKLIKPTQQNYVEPPTFVKPLMPKYVRLGEIVLLEIEVESNPCASFQWFIGNRDVLGYVKENKIHNIYITNKQNVSCLCIENMTQELFGIITCRAENFGGSVSSSASLSLDKSVKETPGRAPEFISPLQCTTVMDGEPIILKCTIDAEPWPKIDWYLNGNCIEWARDITVGRQESGLCELCIKEAFPEMSGTYSCVAENEYGRSSCECIVTVEAYEYVPSASEEDILSDEKTSDIEEFAPKIIKALPTVVSAAEGELTRFVAKAIGVPTPETKWLKQGEEIHPSEEYQIEELDDGTSILIIPEVYQDDTGEVSFEATNPLGAASTVAALSVESVVGTTDYRKPEWVTHMEKLQKALKVSHFVPTFVKTLTSQRARVEQTVIFTASYTGVPKPDITWYKDGEVIKTDEIYTIENDGETTVCKITTVNKSSEGTYRCEAVSDVGKASTTATLRVIESKETVDKVTTKKTKIIKKDQRRQVVEEVSILGMEEVPDEVTGDEAPIEESTIDRIEPEVVNKETVEKVTIKKTKVKKDLRKDKVEVEETVEDIIPTKEDEDTIPKEVIEGREVESEIPEIVDEETVEKLITKKTKVKKEKRKEQVKEILEDVVVSSIEDDTVPDEIIEEEVPVEETIVSRKEPELVEDETVEKVTTKKTKVKKEKRKEQVKQIVEDITVSSIEEDTVPDEIIEEEAPVEENEVPREEPELVEDETIKKVTTKKTKVKKEKRKEQVKEIVEDEVISVTEEDTVPEKVTVEELPIEEIKIDREEPDIVEEITVEKITTKKTKVKKDKRKELVKEVIEDVVISATESPDEKPEIDELDRLESLPADDAVEIEEVLEVIDVKKFGPGESPLRELAKIGYMLRKGATTEEIESLYDAQCFPALRAPQAQSALVRLVERQGHSGLITEALTQETTQAEDVIAAKVGFRAFMRMIVSKHATVEEVITHFSPEDFKPRSWEHKEASETVVQSVEEVAKKSAIKVLKDTTVVPEEEKPAEDTNEKTKSKKSKKQRIGSTTFEIEEDVTIKKLLEVLPKQSAEYVEDEEARPFEDEHILCITTLATDVHDSKIEVIPASEVTHIVLEHQKCKDKANVKFTTNYSIASGIQEVHEKEEPLHTKQGSFRNVQESYNQMESLQVTEIDIDHSVGEYQGKTIKAESKARKSLVPAENIVTEETVVHMTTTDTSIEDQKQVEKAISTIILQDALNVSQDVTAIDEIPLKDSIVTKSVAEISITPLTGLEVTQVEEESREHELVSRSLDKPVKSNVNFNLLESVEVREIFVDDKSGKYYPELIVPTEMAKKNILVSNQIVTEIYNIQEKEGSLGLQKVPHPQEANINVVSKESILVSTNDVHEKEGSLSIVNLPDEANVEKDLILHSSLCNYMTIPHFKESEFTPEICVEKKAGISFSEHQHKSNFETNIHDSEISLPERESLTRNQANVTLFALDKNMTEEVQIHEREKEFIKVEDKQSVQAQIDIKPIESLITSETLQLTAPGNIKPIDKVDSKTATEAVITENAKIVTTPFIHDQEISQLYPTKNAENVSVSLIPNISISVLEISASDLENKLVVDKIPEVSNTQPKLTHNFKSLVFEEVTTSSQVDILQPLDKKPNNATEQRDLHTEVTVLQATVQEQLQKLEDHAENQTKAFTSFTENESLNIIETVPNDTEKQLVIDNSMSNKFAIIDVDVGHKAAVVTETNLRDSTKQLETPQTESRKANVTSQPNYPIQITENAVLDSQAILETIDKPCSKLISQEIVPVQEILKISEILTHDKEEPYSSIIPSQKVCEQSKDLVSRPVATSLELVPSSSVAFTERFDVSDKIVKASLESFPHTEVVISTTECNEKESLLTLSSTPFVAATFNFNSMQAVMIDENTSEILPTKLKTQDDSQRINLTPTPITSEAIVQQETIVNSSELTLDVPDEVKQTKALITVFALSTPNQMVEITHEKENEFTSPKIPEQHEVNIKLREHSGLEIIETISQSDNLKETEKFELPQKTAQAKFDEVYGKTANIEEVTVIQSPKDFTQDLPQQKPGINTSELLNLEQTETVVADSEGILLYEKPLKCNVTSNYVESQSVIESSINISEKEKEFEDHFVLPSHGATVEFVPYTGIISTEVNISNMTENLKQLENIHRDQALKTNIELQAAVDISEVFLKESEAPLKQIPVAKSHTLQPLQNITLHTSLDTMETVVNEQETDIIVPLHNMKYQKVDFTVNPCHYVDVSEEVIAEKESKLNVDETSAKTINNVTFDTHKHINVDVCQTTEFENVLEKIDYATKQIKDFSLDTATPLYISEVKSEEQPEILLCFNEKRKEMSILSLEVGDHINTIEIVPYEKGENLSPVKYDKTENLTPNIEGVQHVTVLEIESIENEQPLESGRKQTEKQANFSLECMSSFLVHEVLPKETELPFIQKNIQKEEKPSSRLDSQQHVVVTNVFPEEKEEILQTVAHPLTKTQTVSIKTTDHVLTCEDVAFQDALKFVDSNETKGETAIETHVILESLNKQEQQVIESIETFDKPKELPKSFAKKEISDLTAAECTEVFVHEESDTFNKQPNKEEHGIETQTTAKEVITLLPDIIDSISKLPENRVTQNSAKYEFELNKIYVIEENITQEFPEPLETITDTTKKAEEEITELKSIEQTEVVLEEKPQSFDKSKTIMTQQAEETTVFLEGLHASKQQTLETTSDIITESLTEPSKASINLDCLSTFIVSESVSEESVSDVIKEHIKKSNVKKDVLILKPVEQTEIVVDENTTNITEKTMELKVAHLKPIQHETPEYEESLPILREDTHILEDERLHSISPRSSDIEESEEIITKFMQTPGKSDPVQIKTKRTILRKKKKTKSTLNRMNEGSQHEGDIVIEETIDDDFDDTPTRDSKHSVKIEEYEGEEISDNTVADKSMVELPDDNFYIPKILTHVHIEEMVEIDKTPQKVKNQEEDKIPVGIVQTTKELTDDTLKPFKDLNLTDHAQVVEEKPEEVIVTEVETETGETKKVKTTKRVTKKDKGKTKEVTEIITVEKDTEKPVTGVTITEKMSPEKEDIKPVEVVELPEETTFEETETPEGKRKVKKITKRTIRKLGPKKETTQIITEQEDDKTPVVTVHTTQELTDETVTPSDDLHIPEQAKIVEEQPEEVKVTDVITEAGETKKVKTTKRVIKKDKGKKKEVTEIVTVEKDGEEPVTSVTVTEEKSPEEEDIKPVEIVELPEETTFEETETPEGKRKVKKITKRIIRKLGPKKETTQIITEQEDDKTPVVTVHTTQELTDETVTPLDDSHIPEQAEVVEEQPEEVKVTDVITETGETKKVKTTKRVIKKDKGKKKEVTEIVTVEKDGEEPVTSVTVTEEKSPEEDDIKPVEIVELPEETTFEETETPEGKRKVKKITKRTIRKLGPKKETTQIITEQEDDKTPVVTVHSTQELTDETVTPLDETHIPEQAKVVEEQPEEVKVTDVTTETGETKKVKTTKRVIKKDKGKKKEITEIVTVEKDGEEPITSVTVTEEKSPEEEDIKPVEVVELPEETTFEETETPEGKRKVKKITKRIIRKLGPKKETTQIITEQEDDQTPVVTVHTTQELTDETVTPLDDSHIPEQAKVVKEQPEEVKVTDVITETGETKKVKTTKRVIKKDKGKKKEVTEIVTVEKDGEEPVTSVTVTEEKSPEEEDIKPVEIVELPEETTFEETETPEGKRKVKKITKRTIRKLGPKKETTQIITEQEDDKTPVVTVHTTQELTDEFVTPLDDSHIPEQAKIVEEQPEEVKVTDVITETGETKKVKTTKRVIKKDKGKKKEVTEIVTVEKDGEEPVTSVTVTEEKSPEEEDIKPVEIVELPEETTFEETETPEGKRKVKKITKRTIRKLGPKKETTQIITEQEDDKTPVVTVHSTQELTDETVTPLDETHIPEQAKVVEEQPEEVKVTDVTTETGETKKVKTTKRVIKKDKGKKKEVTEIVTVEKDGEEPITSVTVTEEKSPEEEDIKPVEVVELPEETTFEETETPEGKRKVKKITKRIIRKLGPKKETTQIITEQEDDQTPVVTVHTTQELTEETVTPLDDSHIPEQAKVVEEQPEEVKVTDVITETGETKKVKTTKRVIKKDKGKKKEVTEIVTVEKDGEEPVTSVTVTEEKSPEEDDIKPVEIVELPEETTFEETETPEGKRKVKKITKRTIRKLGPKKETTQIITEQEDDKTPVVTVHTTQELTDEFVTPLDDSHIPEQAKIVEEQPEEVKVTDVITETGETKKVKTTKRVIKKDKGKKKEVTEIVTVEKDGEEPVTSVTVTEEKSPEEEDIKPVEIVELPEETTFEETETPEGKRKVKKITKRTIRKLGPKKETTQIITEQEDDKTPVVTVHSTQELTDETVTPLDETHIPEQAKVVEEQPEEVKVTDVTTETGETKKVKTTKRVIKKDKGKKKEVTEIVTVEKDGEEPITSVTVTEEKSPEEEDIKPVEVVELPEETTFEETETPEGKRKVKKITKRIIRKLGPKKETTQIITEQEDDQTPVVTVHTTQELTDETVTPLDDSHIPEQDKVVEEQPEEVKVTDVITETGETKKVKTTKRVIKKDKGKKKEVTEIVTVEKDGEEPVTSVTVTEEKSPEEEDIKPVEIVELPEETTFEETETPEGKRKVKKITKRTIRKLGPKKETTQIITEQEDDKTPVVTVHTTQELTDEFVTPLDDSHIPEQAKIVEEQPEEVKVTDVITETGETKKVKTTKRVIKKDKGKKKEVTEIVTVEKDGEEPVTSVTVTEEKSPEEEDIKPVEIVELPEETTFEETETPEGKRKVKKITKRTIRKLGPKKETTQIITEQEDDKTPVVTVHTTQELTDETVTPLDDSHISEQAKVVEEQPEEVKVTDVITETGETKKVKTTKRVIKKDKGKKKEVTEIVTVEKDGEEPVTSVTVTEEKSPEEEDIKPVEIVELPEETTFEETETPEGKRKVKKITKRTIRKLGPKKETTQIITEQEDDKTPVVTVHTTQELTDETVTPLDDSHISEQAKVVEEQPEEVKVTDVITETGETKKVKTTKRVIKKDKGKKKEVTEIVTVEKDGEEPVTSVTVTEEKSPEEEDIKPVEIVELPEETTFEETETPEGKRKVKKITKRTIRKLGPKKETTQIITEQEDDKTPVVTVHTTQELTDETVTPLDDSHIPEQAKIVEEQPEEVKVTDVITETGETKKVKTTKRVIKKDKGKKKEVTEIVTVEKDGEEPVTSVTVTEEKSPEEEDIKPVEIVELPEETTFEETETPEGKRKVKKITKRTIRKLGPKKETTQIITEQEDDKTPVVTVHTTQELTDEFVTPLDDSHIPEQAKIVEEQPEEVKVTDVITETGETKKVKTTKRVIKKDKGKKKEVTEIVTVEKDGEEPVTSVTVSEEKSPEEEDIKPVEIVELPEETTFEETETPEGKRKVKKIIKRTIKKL